MPGRFLPCLAQVPISKAYWVVGVDANCSMAPSSICVAECVLGKPQDESPRTQTPTSTRSMLECSAGSQATTSNAPNPVMLGMSSTGQEQKAASSECCVPTPRVAVTTSLPVLLGRSHVTQTPQRQDGEAEACARAAREAFLARQGRRASRFTNLV